MMDRRQFLASSVAAVIAAKADAAPPHSPGEWRNRQSSMAYRQLGRTGFMVSEFVMGGNLISPTNHDHVRKALDMGLNYLDTAPAYGNTLSEKGYAHVIKSRRRDSFFLNSKVSLWDINRTKLFGDIFASLPVPEQKKLKSRAADRIAARKAAESEYFVDYFDSQLPELEGAALADIMEQEFGYKIDRDKNYKQIILDSVDESLTRLGTDHLDLLMCPHGASTPSELLHHPEIFDAFEILKKAGKVRHLGVSAHSDPAGILDAAVKAKVYSAAMVAYSIVNDYRVGRAVSNAYRNGVGVIGMKVARGVFNNRPTRIDKPHRVALIEKAVPGPMKRPMKAYAWALRNPHLTAVISEMGNQALVDENLPLGAPKPAKG
jgi:aryl-alcohol dehydrogenase-like predicted oxidoreductase